MENTTNVLSNWQTSKDIAIASKEQALLLIESLLKDMPDIIDLSHQAKVHLSPNDCTKMDDLRSLYFDCLYDLYQHFSEIASRGRRNDPKAMHLQSIYYYIATKYSELYKNTSDVLCLANEIKKLANQGNQDC